MTKMCTVRLPSEIEKRYTDLAAKTGRTKTFYIRQALETHITDLEDGFQGTMIMERVKRGEEELIPLNQWEKTASVHKG